MKYFIILLMIFSFNICNANEWKLLTNKHTEVTHVMKIRNGWILKTKVYKSVGLGCRDLIGVHQVYIPDEYHDIEWDYHKPKDGEVIYLD